MTTVSVALENNTTRQVEAEPTSVPGLYVIPAVSGGWLLVHGPSGMCFPYKATRPGLCQLLARAMRKVRADWTDLPADADSWPDELLLDIHRVGAAWECSYHRDPYPFCFSAVSD